MNYKGFDEDFECRGMQYEVGKEFSVTGRIEICENGLHSCKNPLDVLNYYEKPSHRYAIVEPSGDISSYDYEDSKVSSRTLKVLKEISRARLFEESLKSVEVGDYILTDGVNIGSSKRIVSGLSPIGVVIKKSDEEIVIMSISRFNYCNWYTAVEICKNFNLLGLKWRLPSREDIEESNVENACKHLEKLGLDITNMWMWLSTERNGTDSAWSWRYYSGSSYFSSYYKYSSNGYAVPFCTLKVK